MKRDNINDVINRDYFYKLTISNPEGADKVACDFLDYLWKQYKSTRKKYCFSYYLHILLKYFYINNILPTNFILNHLKYLKQDNKFEADILRNYIYIPTTPSEKEPISFRGRTDRIVNMYIHMLNKNPFREELNSILKHQFSK